jgi:hypothetical protein
LGQAYKGGKAGVGMPRGWFTGRCAKEVDDVTTAREIMAFGTACIGAEEAVLVAAQKDD